MTYILNIVRMIHKKIKSSLAFLLSFIRRYFPTTIRGKILLITLIALLAIALISWLRITHNANSIEVAAVPALKKVSLLQASQFSQDGGALEVTGTLRSKSEADLRFEIPGRVTNVYKNVGDWVTNGTLIAEVENSAQRAVVTQALGALNSAKAREAAAESALTKLQGGTRAEQLIILEASLSSAESGYTSTVQSAQNALTTAYATVNQSIIHGTDTLFTNPLKYNPRLDFTISDSDLKNDINAQRVDVRYIVERHEGMVLSPSSQEGLYSELATVLSELETINNFYGKILTAINKAVIAESQQVQYAATVTAARTAILGQIQAITTTQNALVQAENSIDISKANLEQGVSGAQVEDIAAASSNKDASSASVTSALGAYRAALSALEKSRIRASVSGTLASFSAQRGDFVTTKSIGRIVGNGGSEVVFYITSNDLSRVAIGDNVLVAGVITGTISSVSSNISSQNKQLEIRANIGSDTLGLANDSIVSVKVLVDTLVKSEPANTTTLITLPLNAIKFTADTTLVFIPAKDFTTLATTTTLIAHKVTLGNVIGDMVEVTGVEQDAFIVTDARTLSNGQEVRVRTNVTTN